MNVNGAFIQFVEIASIVLALVGLAYFVSACLSGEVSEVFNRSIKHVDSEDTDDGNL